MPGAHQNHSITHLLSARGERKYNERLENPDKEREIIPQLPSQAKENKLEEINLIFCQ